MDTTTPAASFMKERSRPRSAPASARKRPSSDLEWCSSSSIAQLAAFLSEQPFVVAASATPDGHVWASVLAGRPGFAAATAPDHVVIRSAIGVGDPLADALDGAGA